MPYFTRVHFRVVAHTHHGEVLHVVGESPSLGCWEPLQGVVLETDAESYPVWRTPSPISLPSNHPVEYKLTLIDVRPGEAAGQAELKAWEGIRWNRVLVPCGEEMVVDLVMHEEPGVGGGLCAEPSEQQQQQQQQQQHEQQQLEQLELIPQPSAHAHGASQQLHAGRAEDRRVPPLVSATSSVAMLGGNGLGPFDHLLRQQQQQQQGQGLDDGGQAPHAEEAHEADELAEADAVMVVSYVLPVTISRRPGAWPGQGAGQGGAAGGLGAGGAAEGTGGAEGEGEGEGTGALSSEAEGSRSKSGAGESGAGESGPWLVEWNQDSIVAKKHRSLSASMRVLWVGAPHVAFEGELSAWERETLTAALRPLQCVPVFVSPELHAQAYDGFCRKHLWPTLHNVAQPYLRPDDSFSAEGWRAYTAVNRQFSDTVTEAYEPGDLVWVHDYHLLLLPSFILRKLRTASVGLFLHTPFPASEIFRTIPVRDELLRGMLNADLIGFHLFEYARSFLTCCKRMLGLEYEFVPGGFLAVRDQKRVIYVQASHVGLEPGTLAPFLRPVDHAGMPPGLEDAAELRAALESGRQLLGGIDECEKLRGLPLKLLAFEQLLETEPAWLGRVSLVQLLVGARNFLPARPEEAVSVRSEVHAIADRINALSPGSVVLLELPRVSVAQRMSIWASLHVAVFSAIREGVNVYPLEYLYARSGEHAGVVVLSETSSCAHVLNGALRVNVWSSDELANAMLRALSMQPAERIARQQRDLIFVVSNTTSSWAERFFVDLKAVGLRSHKDQEPAIAIGFGLAGFRCVGMGGMRTLEVADVLAAYRKTVRRAIFVDWGGTLVPNDDRPLIPSVATEDYARRKLPAATQHCLEELCHDPRNFVMVVSGLARAQMEQVFGELPGVSLAAEHGLLFRVGSLPGCVHRGAGHWEQTTESFNDDWKDLACAIVETYAMRTNGSYVQRKGSSVVWRYEDADLEFGSQQAKEMREHLDNLLQGYPVDVVVGKGYVEVKPAGVDKGVIVSHMLDRLALASGGVDFVLCVGDDSADEKMFTALHERFGLAGATPGSPPPGAHRTAHAGGGGGGGRGMHAQTHVFCATVGRKPSAAPFCLNDHEEVLELLQSLRLHSTRSNRNRSLTDLTRHSGAQRSSAGRSSMQGSAALSQSFRGSHAQPGPTSSAGAGSGGSPSLYAERAGGQGAAALMARSNDFLPSAAH